MLHCIEEKEMINSFVKVQCFSGSTISDLQWHYMQPLMSKMPSTIVIHVGTKNAVIKEATADEIIDDLLEFKTEVEAKLPEAFVEICNPLNWNDKVGATQIIETVNKKIFGLGLNIVNSQDRFSRFWM